MLEPKKSHSSASPTGGHAGLPGIEVSVLSFCITDRLSKTDRAIS